MAQTQGDEGYTYAPPVRGSTGKFCMGRPIANIVDTSGAHWFDREEREQEEGTEKLIPHGQTNVAGR